MLYTIIWVGVLVGTFALMTWLLQASFKAEDRQHLAELNEEYKELLQHEGREQPGLQRTTGWLAPGGPAVRGTGNPITVGAGPDGHRLCGSIPRSVR